ncbi:hypothetical protein [Paenibacillus methanolicus]|uniref:DUF4367 domain-containing protein n=1 Tax=Paenibacillus methanolicus TaxID=582686 RepID=A0A5S5C891_9BACL|nr:hypothetical protein [Paenibacillus methanolicus]TYP74818.1 hypothetical protein BCM02_105365 [Paenibacillus methanolicus]
MSRRNRNVLILVIVAFIVIMSVMRNRDNEISEVVDRSMRYTFQEPYRFPFEVDEASSEVAIDNPDSLHQFIFRYGNKETGQQLSYIVSKLVDNPPTPADGPNRERHQLKNGRAAYYEEDESSQGIWWQTEKGFTARIIYGIDGYQTPLGDRKLTLEELIDLAQQAQ